MKNFSGKAAVITGAASGIGRGIAEKILREGMKIVLADIELGTLSQTEKELKEINPNILRVLTDVSKIGAVKALAQKTIDHFGAVHILFYIPTDHHKYLRRGVKNRMESIIQDLQK
ncbi:MAG: SDR family NAD(P)-dependent oxidoreductase [Promethearchaeota archaeon]